jgi:hypothetical protein
VCLIFNIHLNHCPLSIYDVHCSALNSDLGIQWRTDTDCVITMFELYWGDCQVKDGHTAQEAVSPACRRNTDDTQGAQAEADPGEGVGQVTREKNVSGRQGRAEWR